MFKLFLSKIAFVLAGLLSFSTLVAQPHYEFTLSKSLDFCVKGTARIEIKGIAQEDSLFISWSNGQKDTKEIFDLNAGDYFVNVRIHRRVDTLRFTKDTTLYFTIEKEFCGVSVDKYFSPNDDQYHDKMTISNVQFYPNFELDVFNKWGQRVHHQTNTYEPWDGKWNNIDLPDGTYYFIFFYDASDKSKLLKGDVTILR